MLLAWLLFCSILFLIFDWWDVPIGCIVCLISGVSLFRGMYLYGVVFCAFVQTFVLLCVCFCLAGCFVRLSCVVCVGCFVVVVFVMMHWLYCCLAVCLLCFGCHVLLLVIWLGLDVIGLVFVVGWECGVVGNVVVE